MNRSEWATVRGLKGKGKWEPETYKGKNKNWLDFAQWWIFIVGIILLLAGAWYVLVFYAYLLVYGLLAGIAGVTVWSAYYILCIKDKSYSKSSRKRS